MSFAQRTFRIPEAWKMTRGHAGRIFLVMLALFALVLLAELLLFALGAGLFSLFMPLTELGKMFSQNPALLFSKINPAVWVVIAVIWSLFGVATGTAFAGALAQIYSDLTGPSHADVFS
jgi:amino acid transporter